MAALSIFAIVVIKEVNAEKTSTCDNMWSAPITHKAILGKSTGTNIFYAIEVNCGSKKKIIQVNKKDFQSVHIGDQWKFRKKKKAYAGVNF